MKVSRADFKSSFIDEPWTCEIDKFGAEAILGQSGLFLRFDVESSCHSRCPKAVLSQHLGDYAMSQSAMGPALAMAISWQFCILPLHNASLRQCLATLAVC